MGAPSKGHRQSGNPKEPTLRELLVKGIAINDENWRCSVTMLVESSEPKFAAVLNNVCAGGYRKAICSLSRETMYTRLARLAASDGVQRSPSHQKIVQALERTAATIYDSGDAASLEALLIKWIIYENRLEHQARNRAAGEIAREREREFLAMQQQQQPPASYGKQIRGDRKQKQQQTTAAMTKSQQQHRVASARKPNSKLRKRGEEWKDVVYVDDAPLDGPDVYVLLTGFRDPALPRELIKAGVPLHCILKLENPLGEPNEESAWCGGDFESFLISSPLTSSKSSSHTESSFWQDYDESCCGDLMIRSYCPAWHAGTSPDHMYDSISYLLYDVHEVQRAHSDYLGRMRLLGVHEERPEWQDLRLYEELVGAVPEQAVSVCLVLEALLRQVEANLRRADEQTHQENDVVAAEGAPRQSGGVTATTSLSKVNSRLESTGARARLADKLRLLNLRYELRVPTRHEGEEQEEEEEEERGEVHLILHGDCLRLNACKVDADERGVSLFPWRDPRIAREMRRRDEADDRAVHLPGVLRHAAKRGINLREAKHLLHLLKFRQILESKSAKGCFSQSCCSGGSDELRNNDDDKSVASCETLSEDKSPELDSAECSCQRANSSGGEPPRRSLVGPSSNGPPADSLSRSDRRASIDTAELLRKFEGSSQLFGLVDPRETLGLGGGERAPLAFRDAETLAESNFWRMLDDCSRRYAGSAVEYFAPTDSVLVAFYDEPSQSQPGEVTCALRTAVCLRDFHEYVMEEEREWLDGRRSRMDSLLERCTSAAGDVEGPRMAFRDTDFLLPGSLKACDLETVEESEGGEEAMAGNNTKSEKAATSKGKKQHRHSSSVSSAAATPETQPLAFDFIGYDLGRGRVQVSNLRRVYEGSDGTRLLLTREIWLQANDDYDGKKSENSTYSVSVEKVGGCSNGWSFMCHEAADESCLFHLTTGEGIIVAFSRNSGVSEASSSSSTRHKLLYDVQISWPSGLIIKPVECSHYPFYILQYYASETSAESHRKYLHNGDVVKFFRNGSVVVLRPNGIIITITAGNKAASDGISMETPVHEFAESGHGEVYRYSVLQLDGRSYDVVDGHEAWSHHGRAPLRVSLAEEYDREEKFLRREDGLDALFNSNGELVVQFADGTRTLMGCRVEEEPAHCDWSAAELELYFASEAPEGFVSVTAHSRAEHPSYATVVTCSGEDLSIGLSMGGLRLELTPGAVGEMLYDEDRLRVELASSRVSLERRECHRCGCDASRVTSQATFPVADSSSAPPVELVTFRDGATRLTLLRSDLRRGGGLKVRTESSSAPAACGCERDRCARRLRLFALGRGGDACEYHRRGEWRDLLDRMFEDEGASLLRSPANDARLALTRLEAAPGVAEDWLLDYEIQKVKPKLRSFGGGATISDDVWDAPFKVAAGGGTRQTRFLIARLLQGIRATEERSTESSLISMQKAINDYWREIATGIRATQSADEKTRMMMCECLDDFESRLRDIALARVKTIDRQSYEAGQQLLRKMKLERDERRTGRMIDRAYQRWSSLRKTNVLGLDNE